MESIIETPAKRQKLGDGYVSRGYNSQDDSNDELFETYQTIATVPVIRSDNDLPSTLPKSQWTQQADPFNDDIQDDMLPSQSVVQVTASSPSIPSNRSQPVPDRTKIAAPTASMMAPLGTSFRPPAGVTKTPSTTVINISDDESDGPKFLGDSSEEESGTRRAADIKPSLFVTHSGQNMRSGPDRLKDIVSRSAYQPPNGDLPTRVLPNGHVRTQNPGNGFTPHPHRSEDRPTTNGANAVMGVPVLDITDIKDYQLRDKIKRIQTVLPHCSVLKCRNALIEKKANYDDALDYLVLHEVDEDVVEVVSDVRKPVSSAVDLSMRKKPAAKQQIKAPIRKIHEKYMTSSSNANIHTVNDSVITINSSPPAKSVKPKKRLIQGRKGANIVTNHKNEDSASLDSESDEADLSSSGDTSSIDRKVLQFFNQCSIPDLTDLACISEDVATQILSRKPFANLITIRKISINPTAGKRVKAVGEKIVDTCMAMWKAYEAVDKLVARCNELARPLKVAMEQWGLDIYGTASQSGELELTKLELVPQSNPGIDPTSRHGDVRRDSGPSISTCGPNGASGLLKQPSNMSTSIIMKDYQIVGLNWLSLLYNHGLSCILADDMGLGKTCQIIAFLASLLEKGIKGPHLIIVPGSTLENWLREFESFCPALNVAPYYADLNERPSLQEDILANPGINVVITTYTIAKKKDDNKFLRRLKPVCCIYDEGHILKNSKSAGYDAYMRIQAKFRVLLTGTPLQNNLRELASLLGFILPSVFAEHIEELEAIFCHKAKTTDEDGSRAALLSMQRIARAKSMMAPFVLRRKKYQVLKHLPAKHTRVEYCEMTESQVAIYTEEKEKAMQILNARKAGDKVPLNQTANVMMALRKASMHPLLFRKHYPEKRLRQMAKACMQEEMFRDSNIELIMEDMRVMDDIELHQFCEKWPTSMSDYRLGNDEWMDSGKVHSMKGLLERYKEHGDRVLIFSQFVMVMNILELVMESLNMRFFRLDGSTPMEERQTMIDEFYNDTNITVFMLSTKAGGAGINLACANKVVIFDSSFNPQDDVQAENRAHRVGQTREVEVVRLVTRHTIEEQIHALGQTKLALDNRVSEASEGDKGRAMDKTEMSMVEEMILKETGKATSGEDSACT